MRLARKWVQAALLVLGLWLGLAGTGQAQQVTQCVTNAQAGGTGDAITVPLLPCGTATNILLLTLTATNSTTTPTLQMPGGPALPIKLASGSPVAAGALAAGAVVQMTGTGTSWLLMTSPTGNIANLNIGTGLTSVAGTLTLATQGCSGGQVVNGVNLGTLTCATVSVPGTLVNPANYSVVCDGVTNTLTALNAMLAAIPSGSIVLFPPTMCNVAGSILVTQPVTLWFPNGGGINETTDGVMGLEITSGNVYIMGAAGATINGTRTPTTGNDYVAGSNGIFAFGSAGAHISYIRVDGMRFTNWKSASVWTEYCDNCWVSNSHMLSQSYAGFLCEVCSHGGAVNNYVNQVSSSNGPASSSLPTGTKTNAYGITFTTDGLGNLSSEDYIAGNEIYNIPTWECADTHAGIHIHFIGNICSQTRVGIQITTDGATIAPQYDEVIGNTIICAALGSPIYPGGPSTSVGGAGIYTAGISGGAQATDIKILDNTVVGCGSSENATSPQSSIEAGDVQSYQASGNHMTTGRWRGFYTYGHTLGSFTGNSFNSQVAGPLGAGNTLIDVESTTTQLLLGQNWGNSSGSIGYCVPASIGGTVGVARDNTFFNLSSLYDAGCGGNANRTDLGATAP